MFFHDHSQRGPETHDVPFVNLALAFGRVATADALARASPEVFVG